MDDINSVLYRFKQEHLLKFYKNLNEKQQVDFMNDLNSVDWEGLNNVFETQVKTQLDQSGNIKPASKLDIAKLKPIPPDCIEGTQRCSQHSIESYRTLGLSEISAGRVAVLVMAGGQGTRLGVNYPKGMYNIGNEPNNSLFHLQAARIKNVMKESNSKKSIIWYVMTSSATTEATKKFFLNNGYFGLNPNEVILFEQNNIPSFDFDCKVFLDEQWKLSKSPNGNGGIFEVLHERGIIVDMMNRGIEHLHVHSVDNVLVRVCDPVYIGYCVSKGADAGAKVVEKTHSQESVGTICKYDGRFEVIEYTEIPKFLAELRDPDTSKLTYSAGNICDQYFRVGFLNSIKDKKLEYHIAIKKIPHVDPESGERIKPDQPNGIKLEKFIFDVFKLTDKFVAWEVAREDEFSPVKNAPGTEKDNPDTALIALKRAYSLGLLKM